MEKSILLNSKELNVTIQRLACQLIENHGEFLNTVLVGIQPRGKYLCNRIIDVLKSNYNIENPKFGLLDITFYRDDFRRNENILKPNKTDFTPVSYTHLTLPTKA